MFDRSERTPPSASASAPPVAGLTLGARLRAERERRGISLDEVARRTKVNAAVFAEMESDNYTRWPPGIFGRSFMRSYAEVVGLDAHDVIRAYLRVHPDGEPPPPLRARSGATDSSSRAPSRAADFEAGADPVEIEPEFRLTLAEDPQIEDRTWRGSSRRQRRVAAVLDLILCALVLIGALLWGQGLVAAFLVMALYFAGGTVVAGSSPTLVFVTRKGAGGSTRRVTRSPAARSRLSHLLSRVASSRSGVGRLRSGRRSDQLLTMFSRSSRG